MREVRPAEIVEVRGESKEELFQRLAEAGSRLFDSITEADLNAALWERERLLSTRLGDAVALPHAQLASEHDSEVIVAICPDGIIYDGHLGSRVYLVFCVVGGARDHLATLSRIASRLQASELLEELIRAARRGDAGRVREVLVESPAPHPDARERHAERAAGRSQRLWLDAIELARAVGARCILLHASASQAKRFQVPEDLQGDIFVISPESLGIPTRSLPGSVSGRISISLLYALTEGRIRQDDVVVAFYGSNDSSVLDTIQITDVNAAFGLFFSVSRELSLPTEMQRVMLRVIELAAELAFEGREGKPTGALFVIGDLETIRSHCQQMLMNPFKGYESRDRNVLDPGLAETVKELSRIDGAFVINADGAIESAGTYLRVDVDVPELPSGLGARHAAAASITAVSESVAIAVSESTRQVSIFRHGRRVIVL